MTPSMTTCTKCRMRFEIKEPDPRAERGRCPECERPMWDIGTYPIEDGERGERRIRTGMCPCDYRAWIASK